MRRWREDRGVGPPDTIFFAYTTMSGRYTDLLSMLVEYPWSRQSLGSRVAAFRKGQYTANVGFTIRFMEEGHPVMPSMAMYKNEFKIYNECKRLFPDFPFESIQINKNFECPRHRDMRNKGDTLLMGLGDYTGGRTGVQGLKQEGEDNLYDIRYSPLIFNGSQHEHWVEPFGGDRYSIVLFDLTGRGVGPHGAV